MHTVTTYTSVHFICSLIFSIFFCAGDESQSLIHTIKGSIPKLCLHVQVQVRDWLLVSFSIAFYYILLASKLAYWASLANQLAVVIHCLFVRHFGITIRPSRLPTIHIEDGDLTTVSHVCGAHIWLHRHCFSSGKPMKHFPSITVRFTFLPLNHFACVKFVQFILSLKLS